MFNRLLIVYEFFFFYYSYNCVINFIFYLTNLFIFSLYFYNFITTYFNRFLFVMELLFNMNFFQATRNLDELELQGNYDIQRFYSVENALMVRLGYFRCTKITMPQNQKTNSLLIMMI